MLTSFIHLFLLISQALSLNIVVYLNLIGKSHLNFASSLIDELVERGHNVDAVFSRLNTAFEYDGVTKARNVIAFEFNATSPWMKTRHLQDPFEETPLFNLPELYQISTELCRVGLASGEVLSFLREGKYDVMLASQYEYCGIILAKAMGIESVIGFTSTNILPTQAISAGLPNSPNCITSNLDSDKGSLTLWGRLKRLYRWTEYSMYSRARLIELQTNLAREYFGFNFPNVEELEQNLDLLFINSNDIIEMPRALSPKIVSIGGVGVTLPKHITKDFEHLLDLSSIGTVLISFGTQVPANMISKRVKDSIIQAAKSLPQYTFIFKYELQPMDEELFSNATNLYLRSWIPQKDLLFDGRISAFVSHMGLNSFLETSQAGVPLVAIPLFADQGHNARSAARLGTGIVLEKTSFTERELTHALEIVLTVENYKNTARSIASMLKDSPFEAREKFIKWTEFVATHKNLHKVLNLPEVDVSFFFYYCIDLVLFSLVAVFSGLYVSYFVLNGPSKLRIK